MGVVDIWGNYHFHGKPKIPDGKSNGMRCNKEDPPQGLIHGRLTLTTQHNTTLFARTLTFNQPGCKSQM